MNIQPQPFISRLEAYTPGEQPGEAGVIKLNTNEFPYPPAPEVAEAIRREAGNMLRQYPSPRCNALRERLARRHGVEADQVFVGNGSDEVLRLLIHAFGGPGRTTASLRPTYSLYSTLAQIANGDYQEYLLDDLESWPQDLSGSGWDVFLLCVPNPPVGTLFGIDKVKYLSTAKSLLVLDEAYIDFAEGIDSDYTGFQAPNVVRTRTFSKAFALAGLRVGYAFGPRDIIAQISKIADSYNVNRVSQAAALAALDAEEYYAARIAEIRTNRSWLAKELDARGFQTRRSHGNFVFTSHPRAREIYEALKSRGILVRHFPKAPLSGGLRISIGTREELQTLLRGLDASL